MDNIIHEKAEEWMSRPFDEATVAEIRGLVHEKNEKELTDRFYRNLEFGTGGLRGVVGAGTNRMNIYTVGMATQGLANYIIASGRARGGVVIARDSRNMSLEFARETASIMAGNGIPVRFFEDITPTPLCSFAVRKTGATAGVVITASHNPPEYNGYKVYWSDGGQIVPPHDKNIIAQVEKIESVASIKKIDFTEALTKGIITILKENFHDIYISALEKEILRGKVSSPVKIVYSPLHGSGYRIVPMTLRHFGFNDIHVESEQSIPDGNFPTVESPNPEEPDAMRRALELAKKVQADIVMATDPDSDRMGIAFRNHDGEYVLINGNQIGVMLEYYILTRREENKTLPSGGLIVKTIVTSEIQREVAEHFGCRTEDVLTGFKWIAALIEKYEESGEAQFIFGGEESYGYLGVPFVRDKDAVSSCLFFAEMTDWLKSRGMTPMDFLDEIYLKFHCYLEDMHSLTMRGKDGLEKIKDLMKRFRA